MGTRALWTVSRMLLRPGSTKAPDSEKATHLLPQPSLGSNGRTQSCQAEEGKELTDSERLCLELFTAEPFVQPATVFVNCLLGSFSLRSIWTCPQRHSTQDPTSDTDTAAPGPLYREHNPSDRDHTAYCSKVGETPTQGTPQRQPHGELISEHT